MMLLEGNTNEAKLYTLFWSGQSEVLQAVVWEVSERGCYCKTAWSSRSHSIKNRAEQYETDPNNIFEKRRKTGRPCILNEEHKKTILEYIDPNPSVVLDDVMKHLKQVFT